MRALLLLFLLLFPQPYAQKPLVVTTIYPIASLIEDLTGNAVDVYSITPKGLWVHSYVVSSEDIEETQRADASIAIGAEEFLSELPLPPDSLIISEHIEEYSLRINASWGLHGMRFYAYDLEKLVEMISNYLSEKFPRLNETIRENAHGYINNLEAFLRSLSSIPRGSVVASFPLIAYMCKTFNVSVLGPIMPGAKQIESKRPIVSFIESKNTPIDDTIRGVAEKNEVPVYYIEAFSADPLTEIIKASSVILGASVADYYIPKASKNTSNIIDISLLAILLGALLYFSLRDVYASYARRRRGK